MVSVPVTAAAAEGLRQVNLRTDLAPLADLMEIAFADSMDNGGRAAIREMRALSRLGGGVSIFSGVNELVAGIGLGYVWMADGRLIGNVSIYPASLPAGFPRTWIIANVAVHPDYRGRGIARRLMETSLAAVRGRGEVLLQVEERNVVARRLYETLDFDTEGVFTTWRRPAGARRPPPSNQPGPYITRRTRGEWKQEYALAQRARALGRGGIGWLRPLHQAFFHRSLWQSVTDAFNLRSLERLIIRSASGQDLLASLWVERAFGAAATQLTLLLDPENAAVCGEALVLSAVRRFDGSLLTAEHPADDPVVSFLLQKYSFAPQRTLVHMRWRQPRLSP